MVYLPLPSVHLFISSITPVIELSKATEESVVDYSIPWGTLVPIVLESYPRYSLQLVFYLVT